jgi:hypothetical protein
VVKKMIELSLSDAGDILLAHRVVHGDDCNPRRCTATVRDIETAYQRKINEESGEKWNRQ